MTRLTSNSVANATTSSDPNVAMQGRSLDLALALTVGSLLVELRLPGKIPVFTLLVAISFTIYLFSRLQQSSRMNWLTLIPLASFFLVHLGFLLRVPMAPHSRYLSQALVVVIFVWMFVGTYSRYPMKRFSKYLGVIIYFIVSWTAIWHITHGYFVGWKHQGDVKTVFSLIPLAASVFILNGSPLAKKFGGLLFLTSSALIIMSGERKALILLGISLLFVFNIRNPLAMLAIVGSFILMPFAGALDPTGYIDKQFSTLVGFAGGTVEKSISNDMRDWQANYIWTLIKQNPAFGIGTGGYLQIVDRYFREDWRGLLNVHGEILRIAVENGAFGLIIYGSVVTQALYLGLAKVVGLRRRTTNERKIAILLIATCLIYSWFEAIDIRCILATAIIPFVGYLRLGGDQPDWLESHEHGRWIPLALRPAQDLQDRAEMRS